MNNKLYPEPTEHRSIWLSPEYRSTSDDWIGRGVPFLIAFLIFRYDHLNNLPFIQETPPALTILQIPCLIGIGMSVVMIGLGIRNRRNTQTTMNVHNSESRHHGGQHEENEMVRHQRIPTWVSLHSLLWPRFHEGMLLWIAGTAGSLITKGDAVTAVVVGVIVAVIFVLLNNLNDIRQLF